MKKTILLLLVLLIVPFTFAEIKQVDNTVLITVSNNILKINSTGINYERDLGTNVSSFDKELTYSYYVNLTCDTSLDLEKVKDGINNVTASIIEMQKDSNYYELYAQCNMNLSNCVNYKIGNDDFKNLWTQTTSTLSTCNNDRQTWMNKYSFANATSQKAELELNDSNSRTWLIALVGAGGWVWAIVLFRKYQRKENKANEHPQTNTSVGLDIK